MLERSIDRREREKKERRVNFKSITKLLNLKKSKKCVERW